MANKPPQDDPKKKVEEHGENLSDSECSETEIDCETCGASFSSEKSYHAHLQGKKHQRKVAEAKFKAKNQASIKRAEKEQDDAEDDDEDSDRMHCEVCDKYFSGYMSYTSHMKGSTHAKNAKKEKLKEKMKGMPEVIDGEMDSDDDDYIFKPFAVCKTCQKQFSGPESFNMHMKSAAHKKKVKQSSVLKKLKSELPDGQIGSDDNEEFFKKCDTCQKSFSGVVPYKAHMVSKVHQKNLQRKKVAEEIKESYDFDDGYICKECKKSFTDPLALKMHLRNNSHEKQKAKTALKEFLNAYPEIEFVTPSTKEGSSKEDESDSEDSDPTYYLICKLCTLSFTGPESAQDHIKGKKHISAKKEKKMRKLLENQKKDSNKSDVNNLRNNDSSSASVESKSKNGNMRSHDDFEMI